MKFVTFEIATPLGNISRIGALAEGGGGQIALDLAGGYAALLQEKGEEPRFREYADFRLPQDMCELMAGGGAIPASRQVGAGNSSSPTPRGVDRAVSNSLSLFKRFVCALRCPGPSRFAIF